MTEQERINIEGSCLCGAVRFTFPRQAASPIYQCHCSKCRKVTGSSANAMLLLPFNELQWLSGEESQTRYAMQDGWATCFCTTCGSHLPQCDKDNTTYWVPAGALESSAGLSMMAHIYVDSKAEWDEIGGDAPQFAEQME